MSAHSIEISKKAKAGFEKRKKNHRVRDGKPVTDDMYNAYRKGFKDGYWDGLDAGHLWAVSQPGVEKQRVFKTKVTAEKWVDDNIDRDTLHKKGDCTDYFNEGEQVARLDILRINDGDLV